MKKTLLLSILAAIVAIGPSSAAQPKDYYQKQLEIILNGEDPSCGRYRQEAGQYAELLRSIPDLSSEASVQKTLSNYLRSTSLNYFCSRKVALLYFKTQQELPFFISEEIREDGSGALWLVNERGNVTVRNTDIEEYIENLAPKYFLALKLSKDQKPMDRYFDLFVDIFGQQFIAWRLVSNPAMPAVLYVNQGDKVYLRLIHNVYPYPGIVNFTLEEYDRVRADIPYTGGAGFPLSPFVADKSGRFSFYDARSPGYLPGYLTVLP